VQLDPLRGLLAVPAFDRVCDDGGELLAVPLDTEDREVGGHRVQPLTQLVVGGQAVGEGLHLLHQPLAYGALRVGERAGEGAAQRVPQRDARGDHRWVLEQAVLEPLGAGLHVWLGQQVLGQLLQHRVQSLPGPVPRVGPDVADPAHHLDVGPRGHRLVESLGRPPRGTLAEDVADGVGVLLQPVVQLGESQVDQAVVQVVAERLVEQPA
jgi:hypothetical protein